MNALHAHPADQMDAVGLWADLSETFSFFCNVSYTEESKNTQPSEAIKQHLNNTQPQKRHGRKMMPPAISQPKHALRAKKDWHVRPVFFPDADQGILNPDEKLQVRLQNCNLF